MWLDMLASADASLSCTRVHATKRRIFGRRTVRQIVLQKPARRFPSQQITSLHWLAGYGNGTLRFGVGFLPQGRMDMTQRINNVVLVHGAFADGSGWEPVATLLVKDGYKVSVVQHPETSYADDQKYTKATIDAMDGPVVLVGHSYGGSVITEAGNHPKVRALVYIAAFALDEGESCATIEQGLPQASKAFKPDANGNWWIDPDHFAADFAADIPKEKAAFMAVSQVPISTDAFTHKVSSPAWKTKPTWYMVATADRSINPDQERMMAKRARAATIEVKASHVAYMSHASETAMLIEEAATSAPAH
jgi:pimeloyl-ACP methyl ester carboxylesterase